MSKWKDITGKVVSARVSIGVYTQLRDRAGAKGLSLGAYISQVLTQGMNGKTKVYTPTKPNPIRQRKFEELQASATSKTHQVGTKTA